MKYLEYSKSVLIGWTLVMLFSQTVFKQFVSPDEIMACALLFQYAQVTCNRERLI